MTFSWLSRYGARPVGQYWNKDDGGDAGRKTGAEDDPGKSEPKYTEEQYQKGMDEVYAKAMRKAEKNFATQAQTFHSEWLSKNGVTEEEALDLFDRREVALKSAEESQLELTKVKRTLATLEAERDGAAKDRDRYRELHRGKLLNEELLTAASKHNARYPDQVRDLMVARGLVRISDDDVVEVLDEHGEPAHGKTVDQAVQDYLAKETNLVKNSADGGGSGGKPNSGNNQGGSGGPDWSTPAGKREGLREMFGEE